MHHLGVSSRIGEAADPKAHTAVAKSKTLQPGPDGAPQPPEIRLTRELSQKKALVEVWVRVREADAASLKLYSLYCRPGIIP